MADPEPRDVAYSDQLAAAVRQADARMDEMLRRPGAETVVRVPGPVTGPVLDELRRAYRAGELALCEQLIDRGPGVAHYLAALPGLLHCSECVANSRALLLGTEAASTCIGCQRPSRHAQLAITVVGTVVELVICPACKTQEMGAVT